MKKYLPDIWGQDQLFAFSGMEGNTSCWHGLVGTSIFDKFGYIFHTNKEIWTYNGIEVKATGAYNENDIRRFRKQDFSKIEYEYILGDVSSANLFIGSSYFNVTFCMLDAQNIGIEVKRNSMKSLSPIGLEINVRLSQSEIAQEIDRIFVKNEDEEFSITVQNGRIKRSGDSFLIYREKGDIFNNLKVLISRGDSIQPLDIERIASWLKTDWQPLIDDRIKWVNCREHPANLPAKYKKVYNRCSVVLRTNAMQPEGLIKTPWTTPDRWPHRHCYFWDSAYQAPGYYILDREWGKNAILAMFTCQEPDGMIRSMNTPERVEEQCQLNPSTLEWSAWECSEFGKDREFIKELYPYFVKLHKRILRQQDDKYDGLLVWPSFSHGMDNSPRFDTGLPEIYLDLNLFEPFALLLMEQMATLLERHKDVEMWNKERLKLSDAVNKNLWDDRSCFYYDIRDDGTFIKVKTSAAFIAILGETAQGEKQKCLIDKLLNPDMFWSKFPIPTVAKDEPTFGRNMWRGPAWPNYSYFAHLALEKTGNLKKSLELAHIICEEIYKWYETDGGLYEFYDADSEISGRLLPRKGGVGALNDYGWAPSLFLHLCKKLFS